MKLLKAHVVNFGSYRELAFDYSDLGLSLVYGATGSGKSSLLDIAPWVLFGLTAKGGKVDDIRSWQSDEPTEGTLTLQIGNDTITVKRVRGTPTQNDLLWWDGVSGGVTNHRGKDIKDTQRLLNERLGVTPDLYLAAAYASEFSPTARFFTETAKRQREIFDLVADLSFPITLAERASSARKEAKKELDTTERSYAKATGRLEELLRSKDLAAKQAASWEKSQARAIAELEARAQNFEAEKAEKLKELVKLHIEWDRKKARDLEIQQDQMIIYPDIDDECPTCGEPISRRHHKAAFEKYNYLQSTVNPYLGRIEDAEFNKPGFDWMIKCKKEEDNPYASTLLSIDIEHATYYRALGLHSETLTELEANISSLTQLIDLSSTMRGTLLTRTVSEIQTETNRILETYFDGEIRVAFTLDDDSLQVGITKNGYECNYAQLSKGQRQLLKLSFMASVMRSAANEAGIRFDQLFFDESLDGLDSDLKVKAYGLFQELAQDRGVLVIDHSQELREMFDSRIHVTLNGDHSELEHE